MRFKSWFEEKEFNEAPELLKKICHEFDAISQELGVNAVVTRVKEKVEGSSGVHEAGRAVDFRDEHPKGEFLYDHDKREKIVTLLNLRYSRKDGKPTCLWHSFKGGMHHFHVQIPTELSAYERCGEGVGEA